MDSQRRSLAWRLLNAHMHALATVVFEQAWTALPAWPIAPRTIELVAGTCIVAFAFVLAQLLLFVEELWWQP